MTSRHTLAVLALAAIAVSAVFAFAGGDGKVSAAGGVTSIGAGYAHTCAVLADGSVKCWGDNEYGQLGDGTNSSNTTPVDVCATGSGTGCSGGSRLTGIVAVAGGREHTCALTVSGGVKCWGRNHRGQLGDGTFNDGIIPVNVCASGSGSTCSGGAALTGVDQVDAGGDFSCALMANTGIKCWGRNAAGQLGIGTDDGSETLPVNVCVPGSIIVPFGAPDADPAGISLVQCFAETGFTSVTTGEEHACGLTTEGGAKCWGGVLNGAPLGDGTEGGNSRSPVDVCTFPFFLPFSESEASGASDCIPVSGYTDIQAGFRHTCALTAAGGVKCWGRSFGGELGDGTDTQRLTPVSVCASGSGPSCSGGFPLAGISAVAVGQNYSCVIAAAGDARCWGTNGNGVVGDGTTVPRLLPVAVEGLTGGVTQIAGGARAAQACAATEDGRLRCWGWNLRGQLGRGTSDNDPHPLPGTVSGFGAKATATPTSTGDTPTSTPAVATNTPGPGATDTPTPPAGGLVGDVDCSGSVNAIDAALILQLAAGLLGSLPCPENADVNGDGNVSAIDAALILQFAAGLLNSLPP